LQRVTLPPTTRWSMAMAMAASVAAT